MQVKQYSIAQCLRALELKISDGAVTAAVTTKFELAGGLVL
jgi:hypothetical protein